MQSVSSRIWIRVAVSISYDDNHYTTGTSTFLKGISPKVNIIARMEFEFANSEFSTVAITLRCLPTEEPKIFQLYAVCLYWNYKYKIKQKNLKTAAVEYNDCFFAEG